MTRKTMKADPMDPWVADEQPGREGAIFGPEANDGEGGTVLYLCDGVGGYGDPADDRRKAAVQLDMAREIARLWNEGSRLCPRVHGRERS